MASLILQISLCAIVIFVQNVDSIPLPCFGLNGQVTPGANGAQSAQCAPAALLQKFKQVKAVLMALIQKKMGELRIICGSISNLCGPDGTGPTPEQLQQLIAANMVLNPPAQAAVTA